MITKMQNRLSQGWIALKCFEASQIEDQRSGADRMPAKAGSGWGVYQAQAQPQDTVRRDASNGVDGRETFAFLSLLILWYLR